MDWIKQLVKREFRLRPKMSPPAGTNPYHIHHGTIPVLLSAAHSTRHQRNGQSKFGEEFTAGFAQLVAEQSGAFAFYPRFQQMDDPNFSAESPYKTQLAQLITQHNIQFVLDIHGCTNRHHIGLALGTINGRSCPNIEPILIRHFIEHGWQPLPPSQLHTLCDLHPNHFVVNWRKFAGGIRQHTTTRFVSQTLGIEAAQLEICSTLRVPFVSWGNNSFRGDSIGIQKTLEMLITAIEEISYTVR